MTKKRTRKKDAKKNKKFGIEYLQIITEETISSGHIKKTPYDIEPLLEDIQNLNPTERVIDYYDDTLRIESINKIDKSTLTDRLSKIDTLWEIKFLRLRQGLVPGLTTEDGEYIEDGLETVLGNKSLTDSVSCLYDSAACLLIVEKNINLQVSAILEMLSRITQVDNLTLGYIPDPTKKDKINSNSKFKSIQLSLANIRDVNFRSHYLNESKFKGLFGAINSLLKFNSNKLYLNLSISGNAKGSLTQDDIIDVVPELMNNPYVNKLEIGLKVDEASKVETINLLDDRIIGIGSLTYGKNEAKKHKSILFELKKSYNSKIEQIYTLLVR